MATDDQLDRVQRLESFVDTARTIVDQLVAVNGLLSEAELAMAAAPPSALQAKREIAEAIPLLSRAASGAALLARHTRTSMLEYGITESQREAALRTLFQDMAKVFGFAAGGSVLFATSATVFGMGFLSTDTSSDSGASDGSSFLSEHPEIINNPLFVEIVKLIVDSIDDWMLAAGYVPAWLVERLKEMGITGPELAAALLIASGQLTGKLTESGTAFSKRRSTVGAVTPPAGWEDRIARLPDTANNGGYQIKIEKYTDATGRSSFEVYVSGTQTFSTSKTATPFDMTSNMKGIAGQPNASLSAVEKAMKAAGIKPGDPVNITGHSQGGLIAHEVAASGHWNVKVVLEAGPPAAHTTLPAGATEVILAHREDLVTALGGSPDDDKAIVVKATAFPDGSPDPVGKVPAHDTDRYQHTAKLLDGAASSVVNDAKDKANSSEKGASSTVTTTYYKAERVR